MSLAGPHPGCGHNRLFDIVSWPGNEHGLYLKYDKYDKMVSYKQYKYGKI